MDEIREYLRDEYGIRIALYRGYRIDRLGASYGGQATPEKAFFRIAKLTNPADPETVEEISGFEFTSLKAACARIDRWRARD